MKTSSSLGLAITLVTSLAAESALAAEGIELIGYGARQKALAGADVADSRDPMALSVNPAGIVGMGREYQFGLTALLPERGYSAIGNPHMVVPGDVRSGRSIFPVPNSAYVSQIDATSAWGTVSYGNGGVNTSYDVGHYKPPVYVPSPFGPLRVLPTVGGPFGGGAAGIDLQQAFFSVVYAKRFENLTFGVAPTFAVQMMNVQGLKLLAPLSSDPSHFTDNSYDWSFGAGLRVGAEYRVTEQFRVGLDISSPMFMSPFKSYAGLFSGGGRLNMPAHIQAGLAFDILPNLTVMADWKHIYYSGVPALHNSSFPIMPYTLGLPGGPGLNWRDTDAEAVAVEWRALANLTLRVGYLHSSIPIQPSAVTLNVLAPAIGEHHISGGFKYDVTKNSSIDFAVVYAPKNSVSGIEVLPYAQVSVPFLGVRPILPQPNPQAAITTWLRGTEFSLSYSYKFDAGDNSIFPSHL